MVIPLNHWAMMIFGYDGGDFPCMEAPKRWVGLSTQDSPHQDDFSVSIQGR